MIHHVRKRLIWVGLCLPFLLAAQHQASLTPRIELQNGRIVIRPAQEKTEESTAWDLLLHYPGMTIEGFDQVFTKYQLRIDGIPIILTHAHCSPISKRHKSKLFRFLRTLVLPKVSRERTA